MLGTLPVEPTVSHRRTGEPFGRYELVQRLSSGGMAEVFVARCGQIDGYSTLVAIKRMLPHLRQDTTFVRLFKREARILARLRHSGIARVIEVGCIDGCWFMALELVPGRSVARLMRTLASHPQRSHESLPPAVVAYVGAEVARTLDYVHTASVDGKPLGIVHRDISPQNLIITTDGSVKLIDFGIAQGAAGELETQTRGALRGKAPYMSPEQLLGEHVDARSDLFSLGVVLWEMATGRRLFGRETFQEGAAAVLRAPIAPPDVSAALAHAIMHCLERDPRKRVATAHELAMELAAAARQLDGNAQSTAKVMQALYGTQDEFEALGSESESESEDHLAPSEPKQGVALQTTEARVTRPPKTKRAALLGGLTVAALTGLAAFAMARFMAPAPSLARSARSSTSSGVANAVVTPLAPNIVATPPGALASEPAVLPAPPARLLEGPPGITVHVAADEATRKPLARASAPRKKASLARRRKSEPAAAHPAPSTSRARSVLDRLQRSPYEGAP